MATGGKEKEKKRRKKSWKKCVQEAQKNKEKKGKMPKFSPPARSGDACRVSAKDGQSRAENLKVIKARVNFSDVGLEVLIIRRTRMEEVLKKGGGGDVVAFEKADVRFWSRKGPKKSGTSTRP